MKIRRMLALLFCAARLSLAAQDAAPRGSELSMAVERLLVQNGFSTTRQPLATTSQDVFPFNVTVELPVVTPTASEDGRTTLVLDITQEDAYREQEALIGLLRNLSERAYNFNIIVLCAAQDSAPPALAPAERGSALYARTTSDADHIAAVCVMFGDRRAIYTANRGRISPRWLTALLTRAFYQEHLSFHFPHFFASFYRLGFIDAHVRTAAYLDNAIPAVGIQLRGAEDVPVLTAVCDGYSVAETLVWDSHYQLLPLTQPLKPLLISGSTFVLGVLTLSAIVLLMLCAFSFTSRNGEREKHELMHAWFLIPLTLALSFMSLLLGQRLCLRASWLTNAAPSVQLGAKILFSALTVSLVFLVQELLRVPVGRLVYGYIILFVSLCNIFVFSAIDIQFFLPLVAEYLIIYAVHRSVEPAPIITAMLLMLWPFAPYVLQIMRAEPTPELEALVFCEPRTNFLLTLLCVPFQIMWLRVLLWFKLYRRAGKEVICRLLVHSIVPAGIPLVVTVIAAVLLGTAASHAERQTPQTAVILTRDRNTLAVSVNQTTFSDLTTAHVTITAAESAVRYEVTLESNGGIPLYDSSYGFTETAGRVRFEIPDYPPRQMTIDYAFAPGTDGIVTVTALFATSEKRTYRRETRTVTVSGGKAARP